MKHSEYENVMLSCPVIELGDFAFKVSVCCFMY